MQIINVVIKERMYALNKGIKSITLNWNGKSLKLILKIDDWIKIIIWIRNFIT